MITELDSSKVFFIINNAINTALAQHIIVAGHLEEMANKHRYDSDYKYYIGELAKERDLIDELSFIQSAGCLALIQSDFGNSFVFSKIKETRANESQVQTAK